MERENLKPNPLRLQRKAEELGTSVFLGGPVQWFEAVGRMCLIVLLKNGLYPESKVLDIGCGALRGGYWLVNFLNPGCYFGIEPSKEMVDIGIENFLGPDLVRRKHPRFDFNDEFDFTVFGEKFDYFIARSIWTHASKPQIERMLDSFRENSNESAVFLVDFSPPLLLICRDYKGAEWVGRIGTRGTPRTVSHSFRWVKKQCHKRGLVVDKLKEDNMPGHIWLRITDERFVHITRSRGETSTKPSSRQLVHRLLQRLYSSP